MLSSGSPERREASWARSNSASHTWDSSSRRQRKPHPSSSCRSRGLESRAAGRSCQGTAHLAPTAGHSARSARSQATCQMDNAQQSARGAGVAMLGSLKRAIRDLDRVVAWLMVYGMVNADLGYPETTNVVNGFSDLILELYGEDAGHHARMAVGMATLPLNY